MQQAHRLFCGANDLVVKLCFFYLACCQVRSWEQHSWWVVAGNYHIWASITQWSFEVEVLNEDYGGMVNSSSVISGYLFSLEVEICWRVVHVGGLACKLGGD
jgi:hypothetical protein